MLPRPPNVKKPKIENPRAGKAVVAGTYLINLTHGEYTTSTDVKVVADPRLERSADEMAGKDALITRHYAMVKEMTGIADEIRSLEDVLSWIKTQSKEQGIDLEKDSKTLSAELEALKEDLLGKEVQGIYRQPDVITSILFMTEYMLDGVLQPSSENQLTQLRLEENACTAFQQRWGAFVQDELEVFRTRVAASGLTLINE